MMKKFLNYKFFLIAGAVLLAIVVLKWFSNENQVKEIEQEVVVIDTTEKEQIHLKYGFPIEEFKIETNKVKKNHSLSTILRQYEVSFGTIDKIAKKAKKTFNVRRIRSGHEYSVLFTKDSLKTPEYFIYENTPVEYIVFDLRDTLDVFKGEKDIIKRKKQISGVVESSLWNALVEADSDPLLSTELSDIYAWTIDFFGIAKGDRFNIVYEESFVNDKSIHQMKVLASNFVHQNTNNYAFNFVENDKEGYFDEKGQSLQKAFLKAPLRYSRISSKFSNRRFHPVLKRYRAHHGVDYAAPTGTPVHTIGDGVITKRGYQKNGGGNYLSIKHNSVYSTTYMHLSRFAKGMRTGTRIKQGETIGYVGATGLATGPHLDFRVFKNGVAINPLSMKSPPVSPVKDENVARYKMEMGKLMEELNSQEKVTLE